MPTHGEAKQPRLWHEGCRMKIEHSRFRDPQCPSGNREKRREGEMERARAWMGFGKESYTVRERNYYILFSRREPPRGDIIFEGWFQDFSANEIIIATGISPKGAVAKNVHK